MPTDYFRDLAKEAIDAAWQMTNTIDLSLPGVPGERSLQVRFANWYLKRVQTAATHDGSITAKYFTAAGLVAPPESLMRPGFMLKVLWKSLFGPSKESRQPYVYKVPEGIEPVVAESAYDETPKAA